jgi:hypothetical protein
LSTSVGEVLARMVARGLLTLEDLDQPTPAWQELEQDRQRSAFSGTSTGWPGRRTPAYGYSDAGTARMPRNLAREWIEAHPKLWAAVLEEQVAPGRADQPQADAA